MLRRKLFFLVKFSLICTSAWSALLKGNPAFSIQEKQRYDGRDDSHITRVNKLAARVF